MGHRLDFNVIFWMLIGRFDIQQPTSWYVDNLQLQSMSLYIVCVALFTVTEVPNVTRLRICVFLYGLRWDLNAKAVATKFCLHLGPIMGLVQVHVTSLGFSSNSTRYVQ